MFDASPFRRKKNKKKLDTEGVEPPSSRTLSERSTTYTIDEVRDRERDRKKSILWLIDRSDRTSDQWYFVCDARSIE